MALKTLAAPYLQGSLRPPDLQGSLQGGFFLVGCGFYAVFPSGEDEEREEGSHYLPWIKVWTLVSLPGPGVTPPPPDPLTAEPKITCTVTAHTYLCKYVFVRRLHFLLDRSTKATNGRRALKKSAVASDVTDVYDKRNLFK